MKVQELNSSSKKTKKLIKRAFAELIMEKKEISKVTVTELVKRADISRGTFYTHYDDIYDVANDYQLETIELLMNNEDILHSKEDIFKYFEGVFVCLKKNEEIYRMLISSNDTLIFIEKLRNMSVKKLYCAIQDKEKDNKYLKLDISFYVDGLFFEIIKYFRNLSEFTLNDILENSKKWFDEIF